MKLGCLSFALLETSLFLHLPSFQHPVDQWRKPFLSSYRYFLKVRLVFPYFSVRRFPGRPCALPIRFPGSPRFSGLKILDNLKDSGGFRFFSPLLSGKKWHFFLKNTKKSLALRTKKGEKSVIFRKSLFLAVVVAIFQDCAILGGASSHFPGIRDF